MFMQELLHRLIKHSNHGFFDGAAFAFKGAKDSVKNYCRKHRSLTPISKWSDRFLNQALTKKSLVFSPELNVGVAMTF